MLLNLAASILCVFTHWLNGLRGAYQQRELPRAQAKRTILRVEELEPRVCMDVDLWVAAAAGNFSTAANWSSGHAPAAGDTVQFGGTVFVGTKIVSGTLSNATDDIADPSIGQLNIKNNFTGTITLNNTLTVATSMSIDNGTAATMTIGGTSHLKLPNVAETFNWGGGTIGTTVDFGVPIKGGTMTINGSDVTLNGTMNNYGTVNWQSNNPLNGAAPNINLNGTFNNSGTFNILTANTERINPGFAGTFNNSGTMLKSGANTTDFGMTFITDSTGGNIQINVGTLSVQNISYTGTGGAITLNGGTLMVSSPALRIQNRGTLSGSGTIIGNVENQAGTVNPTNLSGAPSTLTIQGNYQQDSGGNLIINIDSTGNIGTLVVQAGVGGGGTATLGGTLTVNRNPNYTPFQGMDLVFLDYATLTGDFTTFNIPNNQWTDPLGQGLDYFVPGPTSPTTYDLLVEPM